MLDMLRSGQLKALVISSSFIHWTTADQCDLAAVGDQFALIDYGIGFPRNLDQRLRQSTDRWAAGRAGAGRGGGRGRGGRGGRGARRAAGGGRAGRGGRPCGRICALCAPYPCCSRRCARGRAAEDGVGACCSHAQAPRGHDPGHHCREAIRCQREKAGERKSQFIICFTFQHLRGLPPVCACFVGTKGRRALGRATLTTQRSALDGGGRTWGRAPAPFERASAAPRLLAARRLVENGILFERLARLHALCRAAGAATSLGARLRWLKSRPAR